jgi:phosphate transport system protein
MDARETPAARLAEGLQELDRRVLTMGNTVESLFAESVVALVENGGEMLADLRTEDCKAHEQWVEIDLFCADLLSAYRLEPAQVRHVTAALKIAGALKRVADECLRIGRSVRAGLSGPPLVGDHAACVARMVALGQSMLNEALGAFVDRDAPGASALHSVFRELALLAEEAADDIADRVQGGGLEARQGAVLLGVTQRLERIGDEVLSVSNEVSHMYRTATPG